MADRIRTRELLSCYHCGADGYDLYEQLEDWMFGVPGNWAIRTCPDCGLAWLKNQPVVEDTPLLYENYFTHEAVEPDGAFKRVVKVGVSARLYGYNPKQRYSRLAAFLASCIGPLREVAAHSVMWQKAQDGGKILDLGCGSGANLYHLQEMGWQVSGTEPDPEAVAAAKKLLKTDDIFQGFLEETAFKENSFDALISSHVLEHLFDPLATLKECHRVMKPGAQLTFATPNIESLGSQKFKEYWRGLEIPRHFFLFTEKSLREMAAKAGFNNIRILTPSCAAYSVWQGSYLLKTKKSLPGGIPLNTSVLMRIRAILFWGWEFFKICLGSPCGEELILIAEK